MSGFIGGSGGAPTDATYITQTANTGLSAEQALGALSSGILKSQTTTGVLSIAAAGTDYYAPGSTDVAVADGGTGASTLALNGILYGNGTSAVGVTAIGAQGQILTVGAAPFVPAWSTATFPATTTANQILYSSAANTVTGLATSASGVLVTDGSSVPSIATDIPTAVTIGTAYIHRVGGTDVAVADGGTGKSSWTQYLIPYADTTTSFSQIAIGTAGQVLTSNGAGSAPSFQAAAAGASPYDATVGAGGDYADVQAAIDASKSNLLLIANVTEDSDVTVATRLNIHIPAGITLTMGDYRFIMSGNEVLDISGEGKTSELDYTHTTSADLIDGTSTDVLILNDIYFDNNSSAVSVAAWDCPAYVNNFWISPADVSGGGIDTGVYCELNNVEIIASQGAYQLALSGAAVLNNITFSGTPDAGEVIVNISGSSVIMNNFYYTGATDGVTMWLHGGMQVTNLATAALNKAISLKINNGTGGSFTNIYLEDGGLDVDDSSNMSFTNVRADGLVDMTDAAASNIRFNGCVFETAISVAGDKNKFDTCNLLGGIAIVSGADDNGISNCQGGADAGGGVLTITVASGANRTRLVGNMTDVAISDSGTDTELSANTVF